MKLISKISAKTVCGAISKPKAAVELMHVFGIANGIVTGESNFGEFTAFTGQFKAVNLETGEEFRAGKCFLPNMAENMVKAALEGGSVEFAFKIGVIPSDKVVGYEYTAEPLLDVSENDPLEALVNRASETKQLADHSKAKAKK